MSANKIPAKGYKPDRLMRNALFLELNEEVLVPDPAAELEQKKKNKKLNFKLVKVKKYRHLAHVWYKEAAAGNMQALLAIVDRTDGRVPGAPPEGGTTINNILVTNNPETHDRLVSRIDALAERLRGTSPAKVIEG